MRMRLVVFFIFLFFVILLGRIYYLSIKSNIYYEELAKQNAIKTQFIPPSRGIIQDRNGKNLAINELGFSVSIKPYLYIKKQNQAVLNEEINALANAFDLNATNLLKIYQRGDSYYNQDYILVIDFVPYSKMLPHFSALSLRENLQIAPSTIRNYPYSKLASHVIGYIGKANLQDVAEDEIAQLTNYKGKSGIERYYDTLLKGEKGLRQVKADALNREIEEVSYIQPKSQNIKLSIDIALQEFLSQSFGDSAGAAIILDLKDDSILAAGSFPEYDLNPFVTGISVEDWKVLSNSLDHPFTNKMVNGLYPPGSVVKMGVGLSFLNSGLINSRTQFVCEGFVELGGRSFRCWNRSGHGAMDLKHAIQHSCDVYFYSGSLKVGIDNMSAVLNRLGFGSKTGVDLPNEFVGTVPSREWKLQKYKRNWLQGETLNTSIGQGDFLVTPMQLVRHTAQLLKGRSVTPHFMLDMNQSTPNEIFTPLEKSHLPLIKEAMFAVANEVGGTAYRYLNNLPVKVGAKTGTAQVVGFSQAEKKRIRESDLKYYSRSHTWLVSFAPYENPRFVVVVLLEHGGRNITSAELTSKIYHKLIEFGYLQKEDAKSNAKELKD